MILCKRSIQTLTDDELPVALRHAVDQVILIGDFSWSAVASRGASQVAMAVGRSRAAALRRLEEKIVSVTPPGRARAAAVPVRAPAAASASGSGSPSPAALASGVPTP